MPGARNLALASFLSLPLSRSRGIRVGLYLGFTGPGTLTRGPHPAPTPPRDPHVIDRADDGSGTYGMETRGAGTGALSRSWSRARQRKPRRGSGGGKKRGRLRRPRRGRLRHHPASTATHRALGLACVRACYEVRCAERVVVRACAAPGGEEQSNVWLGAGSHLNRRRRFMGDLAAGHAARAVAAWVGDGIQGWTATVPLLVVVLVLVVGIGRGRGSGIPCAFNSARARAAIDRFFCCCCPRSTCMQTTQRQRIISSVFIPENILAVLQIPVKNSTLFSMCILSQIFCIETV